MCGRGWIRSADPARRRRTRRLALWTLLATVLMAGRAAEAVPSGALPYSAQRQVNETISGFQGGAAVAARLSGGWVVAWGDSSNGFLVRVRTFGRDGTPLTPETTVASTTTGNDPVLARLEDGRFLVAWHDITPVLDGSVFGIYCRFLSASGVPEGPVLAIHAPVSGTAHVDLAPSTGGGFVAVWDQLGDAWVRRFDGAGLPLGPAAVASTLGGLQRAPAIIRLQGGRGHLLTWTSNVSADGDTSGESVQWRRLDPTGSWAGPERQANGFTSGDQRNSVVAPLPDGGFALLWNSRPAVVRSPEGEPLGDGIDFRCFRPDGTPTAPEVTISLGGGDTEILPSLRDGPDGELLAAWMATGLDRIAARRLACRPVPFALGTEFSVDDFQAATGPEYPDLAIDADGDFAVVWDSYTASPGGDSSDGAAQLRTFTIGRVARWDLDEGSGANAADSAGLVADDAVLVMGADPEWSWGRSGHGALAFSGGEKAAVASSSDLDIADAGVTVAGWIYLEMLPSEIVEPFASIYDAAEDNYVLYLDRTAAELRFKVTDSDGTSERPGIPEAQLPLRRWFHVAGVYGGDGSARIYLDGIQADIHLNAGLVDPVRSTPSQQAALGGDGVNDRYYLEGRIDELEVWRRGLTPEEVELVRGSWLFGDGFERGDTLGWSSRVPP